MLQDLATCHVLEYIEPLTLYPFQRYFTGASGVESRERYRVFVMARWPGIKVKMWSEPATEKDNANSC